MFPKTAPEIRTYAYANTDLFTEEEQGGSPIKQQKSVLETWEKLLSSTALRNR
jgi:hypothetical protein